MPYAVVVEKTVPISRQRFFAELMDFGAVGKLSPEQVDSVEAQGEGLGAVRTVRIKGLPGPVIERLDVAYDERVFAYSIINETALPLERYIAVVELADAPGGGCHVRWGSNWIAKDRPESDVRQMLIGLYTTLIEGIVRVTDSSFAPLDIKPDAVLMRAVADAGTAAVERYLEISSISQGNEVPEPFLGPWIANSIHERTGAHAETERLYTKIVAEAHVSITGEILEQIGLCKADVFIRRQGRPPAVLELKILDGSSLAALQTDLEKIQKLARFVPAVERYVGILICQTVTEDLEVRKRRIEKQFGLTLTSGAKRTSGNGEWEWGFACAPAFSLSTDE